MILCARMHAHDNIAYKIRYNKCRIHPALLLLLFIICCFAASIDRSVGRNKELDPSSSSTTTTTKKMNHHRQQQVMLRMEENKNNNKNNNSIENINNDYHNNNNKNKNKIWLFSLLGYLVFGALHEFAHLAAAKSLGFGWDDHDDHDDYGHDNDNDGRVVSFSWWGVLFLRVSVIPSMMMKKKDSEEEVVVVVEDWQLAVVRHAGWIASLFLVAIVWIIMKLQQQQHHRQHRQHHHQQQQQQQQQQQYMYCCCNDHNNHNTTSVLFRSAVIVFLEAVTTDLLGLGGGGGGGGAARTMTTTSAAAAAAGIFFCGNFGVILLNDDWVKTPGDHGKTALDLLEKMISITMMRGAQTGGIVAWTHRPGGHSPTPVRVRVVNSKRTDLSQEMRKAINAQLCSSSFLLPLPGVNNKRMDRSVRLLAGHTRFATSSKATMDGTHPHTWCPPQFRRIYPLDHKGIWASQYPRPLDVKVSNFITHNGDLDFYKVNGIHADLETIQHWLVQATGFPVPAPVDSAAIAGLVDILRTAGSFALSIRYVHLLAMPTSKISTSSSSSHTLPTYLDYARLAKYFEQGLLIFCKTKSKEEEEKDLQQQQQQQQQKDDSNNNTAQPRRRMNLNRISKDKELRAELATKIISLILSSRSFKLELSAFYEYAQEHQQDEDNDVVFSSSSNGRVAVDNVPPLSDGHPAEEDGDVEQPNPTASSKGEGGGVASLAFQMLVRKSIDAFFDNDLCRATRLFMKSAVGSFGLMVTSSLDCHRQICIAARGQPMSFASYPDKGIICYGSELAAVKAGLQFEKPGSKAPWNSFHGGSAESGSAAFTTLVTQETCRFDLDDLGGEVVLIDWSGGKTDIQTFPENRASEKNLRARVTPLRNNEFLLPLTPDYADPIGQDIASIPQALNRIQENWKEGGLNRLTAWNLGRKLKQRLNAQADGRVKTGVDILFTGCEVSLWLAEQMASDLSKSFPNLSIQSTSSNKLLGLLGQELSVPSIGFPMSDKTPDLKNTIVIIVSHSGGTFAPLAISNLLQSVTKNIFVVASEWDSQIGKQLRAMFREDKDMFGSRVFTTEIGVRPAEPCSLSVAATHQLLTQIFEYICLVVLSDQRFRDISGAVITEPDLRILERCNQDNILALERIVGREISGKECPTEAQQELKAAGDLWADHVLENARAYIMSFIYVVGTVTSGFPLVTGLATAAGLAIGHWAFYITRFFDALIYFFLPQINIIIIRLFQGRNLRHRMTGRSVVVGDIPWVAQSVDAFLSKIFARSYSIAGLNVLSGNPADHLVHRHTHRVVRGSLLVCGRPDGRLTALTSAECAVNLSVNQASSIQSIGGTCESITIGHNPAKLGLTKMDIALNGNRPKFLCEQILDVTDDEHLRKQQALFAHLNPTQGFEEPSRLERMMNRLKGWFGISEFYGDDGSSLHKLDRSTHSLKGAYLGMQQQSKKQRNSTIKGNQGIDDASGGGKGGRDGTGKSATPIGTVRFPREQDSREFEFFDENHDETSGEDDGILAQMIMETQRSSKIRQVFNEMDADGSGLIDLEEFILAYNRVHEGLSRDEIELIFREADVDGSGELDYEEFELVMNLRGADVLRRLHHATHRNEQGMLEVKPSTEAYFGAELHERAPPGINSFAQAASQHFSMELYESRIASLQRFTAMCVMFHQMGKRVQDFFPKYSLGLMGYKMERTHSIMRIATTASPVSGDAVREQMQLLRRRAQYTEAVNLITDYWNRRQRRRMRELLMRERSQSSGLNSSLNNSMGFLNSSFRQTRMDGSVRLLKVEDGGESNDKSTKKD